MKAKYQNSINIRRSELQTVIPLKTPYVIYLDVCNLCNFKCNFCAFHNSENTNIKKQFMQFDLFKKIVDDMKSFPDKLKKVNLCCHGESLMHPQFVQMVRYLNQANVTDYISIATNGSYLSPELNNDLINSGIDEIKISVEGLNSTEYYNVTGKEIDFTKFLYNIKDLYEKKNDLLKLRIKTLDFVVNSEDKRIKFFDIFGDVCDSIYIENVVSLWPEYEPICEIYGLKNPKYGIMNQKVQNIKVCPFPFHTFLIIPDGKALACSADWKGKLEIGDSSKQSLLEIWSGELITNLWMQMLKNGNSRIPYCSTCQFKTMVCNDTLDEYVNEIKLNLEKERGKLKENHNDFCSNE